MIRTTDLELINSGPDVVVGSRSATLNPSVCWAMGCHADLDGQRITVWLRVDQAEALLNDVRTSACIAAVFVDPLTSRSLQLKGVDAVVRDAAPDDAPVLARHLTQFIDCLEQTGMPETVTRAAFDQALDQLVAVQFTATDMFEQTPGPHAGQPILPAT